MENDNVAARFLHKISARRQFKIVFPLLWSLLWLKAISSKGSPEKEGLRAGMCKNIIPGPG